MIFQIAFTISFSLIRGPQFEYEPIVKYLEEGFTHYCPTGLKNQFLWLHVEDAQFTQNKKINKIILKFITHIFLSRRYPRHFN